MYLIKTILTTFILPPGIFIVLLLVTSKHYLFKKSHSAGISLFIMAVFIWLLSIQPTADYLLSGLEYVNSIPNEPTGDAVLLLGNGQYTNTPDLTGLGSPAEEMLVRLFTAYRLYKAQDMPIVVLGYDIDTENTDNKPMIERFLTDFGVPEDKIIIETSSHDTIENARNAKLICRYMNFQSPILVTSAFHMKRAMLCFKRVGLRVIPVPASFKSNLDAYYYWKSYLPKSEYLDKSAIAIKEYVGLMFYSFFY
ncbi:MAG: YdcF family protein [Nitrospirae bacterium]|nr:YdcF family protein [Nitrospirota bacterium]